jgi:hypothetical protein
MENYDDHILKFTNLLLSKQEGQDPVNLIPEMLLKNNKKMLDFKINMAIYGGLIPASLFLVFFGGIFSLFFCGTYVSGFLFVYFGSIILTYFLCKFLSKKFIF